MGVTPQIFDGIAEAVEGLPDVKAPVFLIEAVFPLLKLGGIAQLIAGRRKH